METDTQQEIVLTGLLAKLQEYQDAIPLQKAPNPPDLLAIFTQLDSFEAKLDSSYSPQLRHYMHQKSYRKAWLFLKGQDSENVNGNCRR